MSGPRDQGGFLYSKGPRIRGSGVMTRGCSEQWIPASEEMEFKGAKRSLCSLLDRKRAEGTYILLPPGQQSDKPKLRPTPSLSRNYRPLCLFERELVPLHTPRTTGASAPTGHMFLFKCAVDPHAAKHYTACNHCNRRAPHSLLPAAYTSTSRKASCQWIVPLGQHMMSNLRASVILFIVGIRQIRHRDVLGFAKPNGALFRR